MGVMVIATLSKRCCKGGRGNEAFRAPGTGQGTGCQQVISMKAGGGLCELTSREFGGILLPSNAPGQCGGARQAWTTAHSFHNLSRRPGGAVEVPGFSA